MEIRKRQPRCLGYPETLSIGSWKSSERKRTIDPSWRQPSFSPELLNINRLIVSLSSAGQCLFHLSLLHYKGSVPYSTEAMRNSRLVFITIRPNQATGPPLIPASTPSPPSVQTRRGAAYPVFQVFP